ncbi:MAG: helix-turn-helix domain-containing protein [Pseudomonadota bacterium]
MAQVETTTVEKLQRELKQFPAATQIGQQLIQQQQLMADTAAEIIAREIPDYSLLLTARGLSDTWEHGRAHAEHIGKLIAGVTRPNPEFVRRLGRLRAEQRFPLQHVLHTYRIGHRVTWELLQANIENSKDNTNLTAMASKFFEFTIHYTNWISVVVAAAYTQRTRELGNVTNERAIHFFEALIRGEPLDSDVLTFARASGLETSALHILVAEAMTNEPLADRLDLVLAQALDESGIAPLFAALDKTNVGLLPADLLERLLDTESQRNRVMQKLAKQHKLRIGISGPIYRAGHGPAAYGEAVFAASRATQDRRIVTIDRVPLVEIAMLQPDLDLQRLLPDWIADWQALSATSRRDLSDTLEAFANADMQARAAAEQLDVHPNTVTFRLGKIRDLTQLDPRHYHDLTQIRAALRIVVDSGI